MILEKDIRYFSRKLNLPADQVRREIEEQDRFVSEVFDTEPERESDPEVVKRIMTEYVRRSEAATVPYVRCRYLYESAVIAAMYIYAHDDDWKIGILPNFYKDALNQAHAVLSFFGDGYSFPDLLVYSMLKLYKLKDIQAIIDCMNEVNRFLHRAKKCSTYFISHYRKQSELYQCYERVCFLTGAFIDIEGTVSVAERIRLFRHLTKLKDSERLMRIYHKLYKLYLNNLLHPEPVSVGNFNTSTGNPYLEEFLEKAYSVMGYKLESLNLQSYSHRNWLRIALSYARHMCSRTNFLIPYNPSEAKKTMDFAAQIDIEDISYFAKEDLKKYFNE